MEIYHTNESYCDDGNNNCGCGWDGGDCCGNNNMNYCDDCECLDPDVVGGDCLGACKYDAWFADGICDSVNNNCGCDWDGGDCCNPSSKFDYCAGDTACDCLDPAADTGCNVGCRYESYQVTKIYMSDDLEM